MVNPSRTKGSTMNLFTGLSAFPLTPLRDEAVDEAAYAGLIRWLAEAGVDSITALGSTGSYAYLSREERRAALRIAIENAGDVPVFAGIGALRTSHVRALAEDAQNAGVAGVLLAPMTYQPHTADDVYGLYADVTRDLSVPLIVYDNPGTTHFTFTDDLYQRITALPNVASIKIPGLPDDPDAAAARVAQIRSHIPAHVTIGISGDPGAATGLIAGCEAWYSVIGGTLPQPALTITRAVQRGDAAAAIAESERLRPLWELFGRVGSLRVMAAAAEHYGLASRSCLPLPIRGLDEPARAEAIALIERLGLQPTP